MIRIEISVPRGFTGPVIIRDQPKGPTNLEISFHELSDELAIALGEKIRDWGYGVTVTSERKVIEVLS